MEQPTQPPPPSSIGDLVPRKPMPGASPVRPRGKRMPPSLSLDTSESAATPIITKRSRKKNASTTRSAHQQRSDELGGSSTSIENRGEQSRKHSPSNIQDKNHKNPTDGGNRGRYLPSTPTAVTPHSPPYVDGGNHGTYLPSTSTAVTPYSPPYVRDSVSIPTPSSHIDAPQPPPPALKSMVKGKSATCGKMVSISDTSSNAAPGKSTCLKQRSISTSKRLISVEYILSLMPKDIRSTDAARATAQWLMDGKLNEGDRSPVDQIQFITYYHASSEPLVGSLRISENTYMFSALKGKFGITRERLGVKNIKSSLFYAFSKAKIDVLVKDSLDVVFRMTLKEMVKSFFNSPKDNTFISARQLELELIKGIRGFYLNKYSADIMEYLTAPNSEGWPQTLSKQLEDNCCVGYLRKLFEHYQLSHSNINKVLEAETTCVTEARVWTNRESQLRNNINIVNILNKVLDEAKSMNPDVAAMKSPGLQTFCNTYTKVTKSFFITYKKFIAEMLRASELMTWLCLGIVIDDDAHGFRYMTASHYRILCQKSTFSDAHRSIYWNYPLATNFRFEKPTDFTIGEDGFLDEFAKDF